MIAQFTTLRTLIQYSVARLRVLCTTRRCWSALLVSSLLVLAVIGTSTAWRARTSGEEPPLAEATFAVSPLAEVVPPPTDALVSHDAPTASSIPPVTLSPATDTSTVTYSAETRDPVPNPTNGEEAQPGCRQQVNATPRAAGMPEQAHLRVQRTTASALRVRGTEVSTHPSRSATRAPVPAIPRIQVVSVSSTAVLIERDGRRQIVRRGARLNGWTLTRLAPTGVLLRRAQQHAVLPLSFGSRFSSNR